MLGKALIRQVLEVERASAENQLVTIGVLALYHEIFKCEYL